MQKPFKLYSMNLLIIAMGFNPEMLILILVVVLLSLIWAVFCIFWMIQILKLTKQSRIINSMTLKTLIKYCESKGVNIDIQKIQKEVEENV